MKTVFSTEYVDIFHDEDLRMLKLIWKAFHNSEQYRDTFMRAVDYASENKMENFLSDVRKQQVISPTDRKWFETVAMPGAAENGLKRAAIIFTGGVFKKYYLNHIFANSKKFKMTLKFFTTVKEAEDWFRKSMAE